MCLGLSQSHLCCLLKRVARRTSTMYFYLSIHDRVLEVEHIKLWHWKNKPRGLKP